MKVEILAQRHQDLAEVDRAWLVDEHIESLSDADFLELLDNLGPQSFSALKRMIVATAKGRSLGNNANREALVMAAASFCSLLRVQVDVMQGDELVEKQARAIAEDAALSGLKVWA